jgi:hypothetical protein
VTTLPAFPLDEQTLGMLEIALDPWRNGHPEATSSSLGSFLEFVSQLGGSDTRAVESQDLGVTVMRDPCYSEHDLIGALVAEIRQLRIDARCG